MFAAPVGGALGWLCLLLLWLGAGLLFFRFVRSCVVQWRRYEAWERETRPIGARERLGRALDQAVDPEAPIEPPPTRLRRVDPSPRPRRVSERKVV